MRRQGWNVAVGRHEDGREVFQLIPGPHVHVGAIEARAPVLSGDSVRYVASDDPSESPLAVILVDRGQFADVYVAERHPIVGGGWVFVPFGDAPCFSCLDERVRVVGAVVELRRRYL